MKATIIPAIAFAAVFALVALCRAGSTRENLPLRHPEEAPGRPMCTDCHNDYDSEAFRYSLFDHTLTFGDDHRFAARNNTPVCQMCHRPAFCADCHGIRTGLKPSLRDHGNVKRRTPHRGDYLTRHRIDGRIDPTTCFRCHGSPRSARQCAQCHR